ncbi:MAG: SycD/LcrH family type III secretion system chaperone [Candidatus Hydrogenedentes bacterium]|nr:SycD/LcrH family type III secretion system chaperone [Candidatus Hydrogenedentota bacterium]
MSGKNLTDASAGAAQVDMAAMMREMVDALQVEQKQKDLALDVLDVLAKGGNLGQIHGLTKKDFDLIYSVGHTFYKSGKYEKAMPIFQFLTLYDHPTKKWWMGLGATLQMMKQFQKAVDAYSVATILDIEDPKPQLQAGYCLLTMKKKKEARSALEGVLLCCQDNVPAHAVFKSQAQALLNGLK